MDALLETRDLDVSIGGVEIARGFSIRVMPDQIWGMLGPNGSGKTTLLLTLAGIRQPDSGQVLLDGRPLADQPRRAIARRLGMLVQHTQYAFDATCLETALAGRHPHISAWQRERRSDRDMARRVLGELGLEALAERSCMELSGGETRRLALATLLVQDPALMLLDEPTNHLDPANQVTMLNHIGHRARSGGRAALMALHEVNLATCYCSHVVLLHGGGKWEAGTGHEMLTAENLSRLYRCPVRMIDDGRQRVFAVSGEPG